MKYNRSTDVGTPFLSTLTSYVRGMIPSCGKGAPLRVISIPLTVVAFLVLASGCATTTSDVTTESEPSTSAAATNSVGETSLVVVIAPSTSSRVSNPTDTASTQSSVASSDPEVAVCQSAEGSIGEETVSVRNAVTGRLLSKQVFNWSSDTDPTAWGPTCGGGRFSPFSLDFTMVTGSRFDGTNTMPGFFDVSGFFHASLAAPVDSSFGGAGLVRAVDVEFRPGTNDLWWLDNDGQTLTAHGPDSALVDFAVPQDVVVNENSGPNRLAFDRSGSPVVVTAGGNIFDSRGHEINSDSLSTLNGIPLNFGTQAEYSAIFPPSNRHLESARKNPEGDRVAFITSGPASAAGLILWTSPIAQFDAIQLAALDAPRTYGQALPTVLAYRD